MYTEGLVEQAQARVAEQEPDSEDEPDFSDLAANGATVRRLAP